MTYPAETIKLKNGSEAIIRSAEPEDAPLMLRYMKTMLGETPFLLRTPEEFDYTPEEEVVVYGDFWVENYNVNGDVLECVSGGNHPGVMHVSKSDYTVTAFDQVADGADFDSSAKELFGEHYDDFMAVYSDSDKRSEDRKITVSDYVNMNGLDINYYQDSGWDPVELYRN